MQRLLSKYYSNLLENAFIKFVSTYSGDLKDPCVLTTTQNIYWQEQLLLNIDSIVLTVTHPYEDNSVFLAHTNYDFIKNNFQHRLSMLEEQYDIIDIHGTFDLLPDDFIWKSAVENMCYYLKPGGFMFISGNLSMTNCEGTTKSRSSGVWKGVLNSCDCSVVEASLLDKDGVLDFPCNYLVVKKNE